MTTFGDDPSIRELMEKCAECAIPFELTEHDGADMRVDMRLGPVVFPPFPEQVAMFYGAFRAALVSGNNLHMTTTIRPSH